MDALTYLFGEPFQSFSVRRGVTHGLPAIAVWPFLITGLFLIWDRVVRQRGIQQVPPARAGPMLGLATLAVLTHPALDWLNTYGMRWLMPFDGKWFYGDAVFIVDPWIWLALGCVPFLEHSRRPVSLGAWTMLWLIASALVLRTAGGAVVWLAAIGTLAGVRYLRPGLGSGPSRQLERSARVMLALTACYVGSLSLIDVAERGAVRAELSARGIGPIDQLMVGPVIADPFAGEVIAQTRDAYYVGDWNWLSEPRLDLAGEPIVRNVADPAYAAAAATVEARRFLTWARFPYASIEQDGDARVVSFGDARYRAPGRLSGPVVRLDANLRPSALE